MEIKAKTKDGGCVVLNKKHGVLCSYAVATVGDNQPLPILRTYVDLPNGNTVQFFCNRETGLVVVDVVNPSGNSGVEILRKHV